MSVGNKSEKNNEILDEQHRGKRIAIYNLGNEARVSLLKSNFLAANLIPRESGIRIDKNETICLDDNAI